ncbi:lipase family alpha/beta hydrolase [Calidifontibacter terrae]
MTPSTPVTRARRAGGSARAVLAGVRDAHGAAATKAFDKARGVLGPAVTPLEFAHEAAVRGLYEGAGLALEAAGRAARPAVTSLSAHPVVRPVRQQATTAAAWIQGFTGDRLADSELPIAYPMTLRRSGYAVPVTTAGLANAYPDAGRSLVIFVHGFVGTEQMWKRRANTDDEGRRISYGRRMESATGDWSALWVRYNTGRRVSENGRDFGRLLSRVVARWPEPVERVVLVGHSMGGLVIHSALLQSPADAPWLGLVTDTVSLGTPYQGAILEKGANAVANRLAAHRTTAWAGGLMRWRSQGIKDLRHGNLIEADWKGFDPDDPADHRARDRRHPAPIKHLAVVGVVSPDPHAWWGRPLGDLIVSRRSARGLSGDTWQTVFLGRMNHMDLLNHPRVYNVLAERIGVEAMPQRHPKG